MTITFFDFICFAAGMIVSQFFNWLIDYFMNPAAYLKDAIAEKEKLEKKEKEALDRSSGRSTMK